MSERVGAEGKDGDPNPLNTHTYIYTHTHTPGPPLYPSLPAATLHLHQDSRYPGQLLIHLLPFFFFFPPNIHPSAVFELLVTYNPHLDVADFPIMCVRVCLVGLDTNVLILDDISVILSTLILIMAPQSCQ